MSCSERAERNVSETVPPLAGNVVPPCATCCASALCHKLFRLLHRVLARVSCIVWKNVLGKCAAFPECHGSVSLVTSVSTESLILHLTECRKSGYLLLNMQTSSQCHKIQTAYGGEGKDLLKEFPIAFLPSSLSLCSFGIVSAGLTFLSVRLFEGMTTAMKNCHSWPASILILSTAGSPCSAWAPRHTCVV